MRAGIAVSVIAHIGAAMMSMLAWEARSSAPPQIEIVVPVEIVSAAAESNVRALAVEVPEQAEAPALQEETVEAEPEPAPSPSPQPRQRRQQADEFDLAAIAGLIDKQRQPSSVRNDGAPAERNQRGAGLGTAEVAALEDRARALARAHLRRCWRMPVDLPDPDRLVVTVVFDLNRNGALNGQPRITNPRNFTFDPAMRTAAEAALRAVRMCDPYPFPDDPVVGAHYDIWRSNELVFSPSLTR